MKRRDSLRDQIRLYRKKYHQLALYRGLISWLALTLFSLFVLGMMEYFAYFNITVKSVLLSVWLLVNLIALALWVIRPILAAFFGIGAISDKEVAIRMGRGSQGVEDKVLNYLQLVESNSADPDYLEALIAQRTKELGGQNLLEGLSYKRIVRAAWFAGIPTLLLFIISLFDSSLVLDGPSRFLDYRTAYKPSAPFSFVSDYSWTVEKGKSVSIDVNFQGNTIPDRAFIWIDGNRMPMTRLSSGSFEWTIDRATEDASIVFEALGFLSEEGFLDVLEVPSLSHFVLSIYPPKYTRVSPFELDGTGDAVVPEGSKAIWKMNWKYADSILLREDDLPLESVIYGAGGTSAEKDIYRDLVYDVHALNSNGSSFSSGLYQLDVIRDNYPKVEVEYRVDSITRRVYVRGISSDDYGLIKTQVVLDSDSVMSLGSSSNWSSSFAADNVQSFYVEVFDNDGVHGSKKTRVGPFHINLPTALEQEKNFNAQDQNRIEQLQEFRENQNRVEELQNDINRQMIDGANEWQQRQMQRQLLERQEVLMRNWDRMMDEFQKENEERILADPENEDNAEKREELERLMEDMNTDKLEELLKELEERRDEMNEDNLRDWMRRVQNENNRMELDAERLEELMKRLAFEQNLDLAQRELQEMANRQQELAESDTDTQAEQDSLNEQFEDWMNQMDSLEKENSELKKPMDFTSPKDQGEKTEQSMQESSENLQEGDSQKANENQQKSSQSMEDMLQQMSSSIMNMQMNMHVENLQNLRRILMNTIHLSESQEALGSNLTSTESSDAVVVSWMKEQEKMLASYQVVKDSLEALIGRVPQIEAVVSKWIFEVSLNMTESNVNMSERQLNGASSDMRESMLALNELSLLLDVTMDEIQQQMSGMMQGQQQCQKPGSGKPSMSNMRQLQQQLSQQMQQMGQQPGSMPSPGQGSKDGESQGQGSEGQSGQSQQIVDMMRRQSQIREMLQEKGSTGNTGQQLDELLEENERDLSRRNFDAEFFDRQREIEIKMLELEEAERQQEQDDQRISRTGNRYQELRDQREEEMLRQQRSIREQLQYEYPPLSPYYRQRSGSYLRGR